MNQHQAVENPRISTPSTIATLCLAASLLAAGAAGAQSEQVPFICTGELFIIQEQNAELYRVDVSVIPPTFTPMGGPYGFEINNLGFRRTDGLLYGWHRTSPTPTSEQELISIDASGTLEPLGRGGLPADADRFLAGDVSFDGTGMYLNQNGIGRLFTVPLPDLSPVTWVTITGDTGRVADWAFNRDDGLLYGGDDHDAQLAILDPVSGVRTDVAVAGCSPVGPDCAYAALPTGVGFGYGAAWFNAAGDLFIYMNNDGTETGIIFEIEEPTGSPQIVRTRPALSSRYNDGAACVQDMIGVAKQMTADFSSAPSGTITIEYRFENISPSADLLALSAFDDLTEVFGVHGVDWVLTSIDSSCPGCSSPAPFHNPGFDGHLDIELISPAPEQGLLARGTGLDPAPGSSATVTVTLDLLTFAALIDGEYCNRVLVVGETADGEFFGDRSTDGLVPDPDGDGAPDEGEPSCIDLGGLALIDLVKTGAFNDDNGDGLAQAGETIGYTFEVKNIGVATLTNVLVSDPAVSPITCPSGNPIPSLASGASETCTGTYAVTPEDIAAGEKNNTATADSDQTDPVTSSTTVELPVSVDLCADGTPPHSLELRYDGTDPEVYIVVTHPKQSLFDEAVADGQTFEVFREKKLNPDITVEIFSEELGPLVDTIAIHTSCSQPLYVGQEFGTDPTVAKITVVGGW